LTIQDEIESRRAKPPGKSEPSIRLVSWKKHQIVERGMSLQDGSGLFLDNPCDPAMGIPGPKPIQQRERIDNVSDRPEANDGDVACGNSHCA
jgi:hypothetical protein